MDLQQGFVLTRHWRDTPTGTHVEFWLATDAGPRQVRLPVQTSVAFIPELYRERTQQLVRGEPGVELRPLKLRLDVRTETPLELGAQPMPQQGPQASSKTRAPAFRRSPITPSSMSLR